MSELNSKTCTSHHEKHRTYLCFFKSPHPYAPIFRDYAKFVVVENVSNAPFELDLHASQLGNVSFHIPRKEHGSDALEEIRDRKVSRTVAVSIFFQVSAFFMYYQHFVLVASIFFLLSVFLYIVSIFCLLGTFLILLSALLFRRKFQCPNYRHMNA